MVDRPEVPPHPPPRKLCNAGQPLRRHQHLIPAALPQLLAEPALRGAVDVSSCIEPHIFASELAIWNPAANCELA